MRIPHEVLVLVVREGVLLVLRRSPRYEAYWHLVAGALEPGESPREAALRELVEEVALEPVELLDLDRRFSYSLAEEPPARRALFPADVTGVRVDCFVAHAPAAWEPTLNDEHDDYRWCTVGEAVALLRWPEPRELAASFSARAAGERPAAP